MKFSPLEHSDLRFKVINAVEGVEYYSVGDIHGCIDEMKQLIDKIHEDADSRGKTPFIICHGDMIDRGPAFGEVLKLAEKSFDICLLGNHEHNFVLERTGKPCNSNSRQVSHDRFNALKPERQAESMRFLNSLDNFAVILTDERQYFLSHAPIKDMERYWNWEHYQHIGNAPYFCMRSSVPIDEDMQKMNHYMTFVYGHQSWEFKDVEEQRLEQFGRTAQYYNIDGSCVYGGRLVALRLFDLSVLTVDSKVRMPK